ncbi:MAG TPA: DUF3352 domain-containing protein [Blastocatellia bacterium]|nr:DUF3352 domain-containing protein [Blastocatellia bacterium]
MKQLISATLALSLFVQPLLAQTANPQTAPKPASEAPAEVIPIEDLLPGDTLAYVASSNLAGMQHAVQLLDAYKVARARLPKEELDSGDNPLDVVARFLSFGIADTRALEGARIGLAVIVPELPEETETQKKAKAQNPTMQPQPMPEPLILLFLEGSRMEDARKAREQLLAYYNDNFTAIGKVSEIKQTDYKGQKLDRFKDGQVGMWFGATYVLSQHAALDRLLRMREDRRAERLADDQEFLRTKTQMMPQTGLFAYVNGKPLNHLMRAVLGRSGNGGFGLGGMDAILSLVLGADAIKSLALASTFDREGVVDRLQLNLDQAKKNLITTLFSGPKSDFKATQYIPAGTEIVVSHSLDWPKVYDDLFVKMFYREMVRAELIAKYSVDRARKEEEARANKQPPPRDDWAQIQEKVNAELTEEKLAQAIKEKEESTNEELGFVLRDELAKDLGNEVTVAYGIPKLMVPAVDNDGRKKDDSGFAVFVGIKDRAATQQALIKAFAYITGGMSPMGNSDDDDEKKNVPPKTAEQRKQERELRQQNAQQAWGMMPTEIYKKVEIKSLFAAWVGFSDEYMIVADSKETIKQMLDLAEGGRTLAGDFNYSRAMNSVGGATTTKVFIGPKMFDGLLNDFIRAWVTKPGELEADLSARAPLNVPATVAAAIDTDATSIKLEAFSPLGIPGTVALWGFGSDMKQGTEGKETAARYRLRELAKAEKAYAKKNQNRYASLETLAQSKDMKFNPESLKDEQSNYRFAFKLKPGGKGYEATASPIKYGRQGRLSFFIDESGTLRRADKEGAPATEKDDEDEQFSKTMEAEVEAATRAEAIQAATDSAPRPAPVRRVRRKN